MTQLLRCPSYFKHFIVSLRLQGEVSACQRQLQGTVCQAVCPAVPAAPWLCRAGCAPQQSPCRRAECGWWRGQGLCPHWAALP